MIFFYLKKRSETGLLSDGILEQAIEKVEMGRRKVLARKRSPDTVSDEGRDGLKPLSRKLCPSDSV